MTRPSGWQGLLVSVRGPAEAEAALTGGADIIDVKEPDRGPLGAASPETVVAIARRVGDRAALTMACGELAAGGAAQRVWKVAGMLADLTPSTERTPLAAAKAGPAGLPLARWRTAFAAFAAGLPRGVAAVAVAYADAARAAAPPVPEIIAAAPGLGSRLLLIDTFAKTGPGVLALGADQLAAWVTLARSVGLGVAVAGRLALDEIPVVWRLGADVVGVRGSVCVGGRAGRVDAGLVAAARHGRPGERRLGGSVSFRSARLAGHPAESSPP